MMGAAVIATSSDEKFGTCPGTSVRPCDQLSPVPDWGKRVRDLTGCGVDHVVEVGGPGTLAQSIEAVRVGGQISFFSRAARVNGRPSSAGQAGALARTHGAAGASSRTMSLRSRTVEVRPVLDGSFSLDHLADAFRYQASGAHFGRSPSNVKPELPQEAHT